MPWCKKSKFHGHREHDCASDRMSVSYWQSFSVTGEKGDVNLRRHAILSMRQRQTLSQSHVTRVMCVLLQVFGSVFLTTILATPVFSRYMETFGCRFFFVYGTLLSAISNILFGALQWIDDAQVFFALSLILRIVTALGESAFFSAIYPLTSRVSQAIDSLFTKRAKPSITRWIKREDYRTS